MAYKDKTKQRAAWNRWYHKNKKKKVAWQTRRRTQLREMMRELKTKLKCCRCGEGHPACLEFHHRKGVKKDRNVSDMLTQGWSTERIQAEINKCDVLCSNCHKKEHYEE